MLGTADQVIEISVIIVNLDGGQMLHRCVESILGQEGCSYEIIVVDNGSTDASLDGIRGIPGIQIVEVGVNLGFAEGNNIGLRHARGNLLFLLNNDATLDPGCLEVIARAFKEIPYAGAIQPKILRMDDPEVLDIEGAYWTRATVLYSYGKFKDQSLPKYNRRKPFFALCGAALCVKTGIVRELGFLDPDFWTFYEEIDLCHRIWISGNQCWYCPEAVVRHKGAATASMLEISNVRFLDCRNRLTSFLKNFELRSLLTIIPIHLMVSVIQSLIWLAQGDVSSFMAIYRAIAYNIAHIGRTMRKRRLIQSSRSESDRSVFLKVKKTPDAKYYLQLLTGRDDGIEHLRIPVGGRVP